jgi:hypothetical protein
MERRRKKVLAILMGLVISSLSHGQLSIAAALQPAIAQAETRSFTGEIMDGACAAMGGHEAMMKGEGANSAKQCTDKCVQGGSKYVLYDASSKTTYQLDDQAKPKEFSGQKVKVTGTYDEASKTIHVEKIEAAS